MIAHPRFRELALVATDFPLAPQDRRDLDAHLAACEACRRYARAVHDDAAALGAVAFAHAPDRVRAAVVAAAARPPATLTAPTMWRLLAAAMLLLLALAAATFVAGSLLRDRAERTGPISWQPIAAPALVDPAASVRMTAVAAAPPAEGAGGNGRFVAATTTIAGDAFLVSDDGVTWNRIDPPGIGGVPLRIGVLEYLAGPDRGGGTFVAGGAVGQQPAVAVSANGIAWTVEPLPGNGTVLALGMREASRIAVGRAGDGPAFWRQEADGPWRAGTVLADSTSPDGAPMALVETATGILAIAPGQTYQSRDGSEWVETANNIGLVARFGAGRRGDVFVAVGEESGAPATWQSRDGVRWTGRTLPERAGTPVTLVDWGGSWVAVGNGPTGGMTWFSADGSGWTAGPALPASDGARIIDLALSGSTFVAVGSRGTGGAIWYGKDVKQ